MNELKKLKELLIKYDIPNNLHNFNKLSIKTKKIDFNPDDIKLFNEIYQATLKLAKADKGFNTIVRTSSGAISKDGNAKIINTYAWDVKHTSACIQLNLLLGAEAYTITCGNGHRKDEYTISGGQAFREFKNLCLNHDIVLEDYIIDNGEEVKKEIEKPLIYMDKLNTVLYKCHHIDFHSSYPTGLINTHPEFKPVIEEIYQKKQSYKKNTKNYLLYKAILNLTIGYMQSLNCCKAKWAHLSRDAIYDNNRRINNLAEELEHNGRTIVGFNTDGIWYQGEIYHSELEGPNLGQWENDHVDCKLRAKSNGSYEFIENDKYYPVQRGLTALDMTKPRDKWEWGDIYKSGDIIEYEFDELFGIMQKRSN